MNLSRQIAWRYLRRPTDRLVSAVGFVSVLGLVIGVMALVISMALMTGYRGDLQTKLLGGNAEIFVYSIGGPIARHASGSCAACAATPGVAEAAPVLFKSALVTTERNTTGTEVMLKGIEPARGEELADAREDRRTARHVRHARKGSAASPSASTWRRSSA